MASIAANGITLDYETVGNPSDPAIVLIRGAGSQRVRWRPQFLQDLAKGGLYVITFDNRDVGLSTNFLSFPTPTLPDFMAAFASGNPIAPPYTLNDMAGDVIGLLDALKIERAHIMGLSMGGYVGQIVAAERPDRVRSLICLASSLEVPGPHKFSPSVMEALQASPAGDDEASIIDYVILVARAHSGPDFPVDEAFYKDAIAQEIRRGIPPGGEMRQLMAIVSTEDRSALATKIVAPTLIVHGSNDPLVPYSEAQSMNRAIKSSQMFTVEKGGHEITGNWLPLITPVITEFCRRA